MKGRSLDQTVFDPFAGSGFLSLEMKGRSLDRRNMVMGQRKFGFYPWR